jgi:hypothetical protein
MDKEIDELIIEIRMTKTFNGEKKTFVKTRRLDWDEIDMIRINKTLNPSGPSLGEAVQQSIDIMRKEFLNQQP